MKAEHRKELETNALADRMGRLLKNVKEGAGPDRSILFYILVGAAVAGAIAVVMGWFRYSRIENAESWFSLYVGDRQTVVQNTPDKPQAQALRLEEAQNVMWEAIQRLGVDSKGARDALKYAQARFEKVLEDNKDDPVFAPEAIFGLAQIEETMAIEDRKRIDDAIEKYQELTKKFPNSARAELARARLEILENNDRRADEGKIYQELETRLRFGQKK